MSDTDKVAGGSTPRQIAIANGDTFYEGAPCKNCASTKKYTRNGHCYICKHSKEANAASLVRMLARSKKIAIIIEKARINGPFEIKSKDPREIAAARGQQYFLAKKACPHHPEQMHRRVSNGHCPCCDKQDSARRKKEKPCLNRTNASKYFARKKNAKIPLTEEESKSILALHLEAVRLEKETGKKYAVDHIIPMKKHGVHHPTNLRVVLASENSRKSANIFWELITPENALLHLALRADKFRADVIQKLLEISKRQSCRELGVVNSV